MFMINQSIDYIERGIKESLSLSNEISYLESLVFLGESRKASIYIILLITLIGLVGNGLIMLVFGQKKFRVNSSNVYLFCLAINDSLYLLVHFSEDTLRAFKETYYGENESATINKIIDFLSIVDKYELTCLSINYLRNVLRSISSYIIVLFTIQRLLVVFKPLSNSLKPKISAWKATGFITLASLIFNIWVLFVFDLQKNIEIGKTYCDIIRKYTKVYFVLNIIYTMLTVILPMIIIVICNISIIVKTIKNKTIRKDLQNKKQITKQAKNKSLNDPKLNYTSSKLNIKIEDSSIFPMSSKHSNSFKIKPFYMTKKQLIQSQTKIPKYSNLKLTIILLIISFSFVLFNLPYLAAWSICFYETVFSFKEMSRRNYLFAALHITEIFYILNYVSYLISLN